jgi:hypothetical protein
MSHGMEGLLRWLDANRGRLALGLGAAWLLAAGAVASRASTREVAAAEHPALSSASKAAMQVPQLVTRQQLDRLLHEQEAVAREQALREARWEQEERQAAAVQQDEALDAARRP